MTKDNSNSIAASMDAILKSPEHNSMFSSNGILEKLAFKRVADEDKPSELEVEITDELSKSLEATASDEARADCVCCGKSRPGWTENMGTCKCASTNGCSPMGGCKDNCSCKCNEKKASVSSSDMLVKSACDALLKASCDLEDAGFGHLSAHALVLVNNLVVEAKSKKEDKNSAKDKAMKLKEKERADKEKAKLKAEKDKNAAKDKAMKERAEKDKNAAKDKAMKEKAKLDKEKADKAKKSGK